MKYYLLTKEEKELFERYDQGDFHSVNKKGVKKKYQEYAKNSALLHNSATCRRELKL